MYNPKCNIQMIKNKLINALLLLRDIYLKSMHPLYNQAVVLFRRKKYAHHTIMRILPNSNASNRHLQLLFSPLPLNNARRERAREQTRVISADNVLAAIDVPDLELPDEVDQDGL